MVSFKSFLCLFHFCFCFCLPFIFVSLSLWSLSHSVSSKLLLHTAPLDLTKKSLYLSQELPPLSLCFYRLKKIWRNYQTYTFYPHFLHCFFFKGIAWTEGVEGIKGTKGTKGTFKIPCFVLLNTNGI